MSSDLLQAAQQALQRGERIHARKLARSAILQNPRDEQAWLLMARVVHQPEQVIDCLDHALKLNPENRSTARALRALRREHAQPAGIATLQPPPAPPHPRSQLPRLFSPQPPPNPALRLPPGKPKDLPQRKKTLPTTCRELVVDHRLIAGLSGARHRGDGPWAGTRGPPAGEQYRQGWR